VPAGGMSWRQIATKCLRPSRRRRAAAASPVRHWERRPHGPHPPRTARPAHPSADPHQLLPTRVPRGPRDHPAKGGARSALHRSAREDSPGRSF
jgi:hypothetical protein